MAKVVNRLGEYIEREQQKLAKEKGRSVNQNEIAVYIGVNPATLSRYINGKPDSINWDIWKKLADYFDVKGSDLFDVLPGDE